MKRLLTLAFALAGVAALGGDIVWLKLTPQFTYKDFDMACKSILVDPLYLAAEVDNGNIVRADIRKRDVMGGTKKIDLTAAEIADVKLIKTTKGEYWMKSFTLTTRLLNWVFFNSGDGFSTTPCRPPYALSSIVPGMQAFDFDLTPLEKEQWRVSSPLFRFKGVHSKGGSYETTLRFDQSQFDSPYAK